MASASEVKSNTNVSNQIVADFKETKHDFYIAKAKTAPLVQFNIIQYEDKQKKYTADGTNIKRSNLPALEFVTTQTGNGNISYLAIDGKELSSSYDYDYNKSIAGTEWGGVTKWNTRVTIKDRATSGLSNGKHTVKVVCAGDKWDVNSKVITDTFTFNLVD